MAVFEYKALNKKGDSISGIIDADALTSAKMKLRQNGLFPTTVMVVENKSTKAPSKVPALHSFSVFFSRIKPSQIALSTRQLATLLAAGFPLVKAVSTLIPQMKSKTFQMVLSKLKESIEQGKSFAESLSQYPGVFSPVYINMVKAGESSGTLEVVLERLADFTEDKEETKKKIQASLAYPVLMALISVIVLSILLTYVVPGIVGIFTDMNQILPLPTRILIQISSIFQRYWWLILLLPFFLFFAVLWIRKTQKGLYLIDRLMISLPVIGRLNKKIIAARFTRTLASLLSNGIPLLAALNITKSIAGNQVFFTHISKACTSVEQGGQLSPVLEQSHVFPYLAVQMIQVGETSGEIEKMLEKTADLFEKDVQTAVTAASALITPIVILIMGVVVACIIFAICLPIFEINQLIR